MNNIIYYLLISIFTLISIICLINMNNFERKLNLKGIKIVLFFIILMSYMTLVSYPIKKILDTQLLNIKLPKGAKGPRGNRGDSGSNAICDTCGDDLCLKKILFNITNTYNYWRELKGLNIYPDTYVIKNQYLKDIIIKQCKSKEFQKIIKKFGSNNKTECPGTLESCGIYDYMFSMWSIWILIILKYKNGMFFLENESFTDIDFDGLIEDEDGFLNGDTVEYESSQYTIDKSTNSKHIHPMYYIKDYNGTTKGAYHISKLTFKSGSSGSTDNWNNMFYTTVPNIHVKIKKNDTGSTKVFDAAGIDNTFFNKEGIPGRGKYSPFHEIKNYEAWYWGRDEQLKPKTIINKKEKSDLIKIVPETKFKITNNYYELFNSKDKIYNRQFSFNTITSDDIKRYKQTKTSSNTPSTTQDSQDFKFLRANTYIDHKENAYFKEYKPIGDILIFTNGLEDNLENNLENNLEDASCLPTFSIFHNNDIGYTGPIKKKLPNIKETYLVSGDTKAPIDFKLHSYYKEDNGMGGEHIKLSIWEPEAPTDYIALGFVVNNKTLDIDDNDKTDKIKIENSIKTHLKPSYNSVACVPKKILADSSDSDPGEKLKKLDIKTLNLKDISKWEVEIDNELKINNITNTFISKKSSQEVKDNFNNKYIINQSTAQGNKQSSSSDDIKQTISNIKDKKYSILKLYD